MNPRLLILVGLLGSFNQVGATHIVGGELTYRWLTGDMYELTLIVYRDCYTGIPWFDDPAAIGVFDENWSLKQDVRIGLDDLVNDTLPIFLSNPCLVAPPNVCVHGTVYKKVVSLPFIQGGYHLVYQRCCRNNLIRNITEPLDTGASFTVDVSEKALLIGNTGATFNYWPPVAICVNEEINFDHSASDGNGDSLAYRMCTPLTGANPDDPVPQPPFPGPYPVVTWIAPYNVGNMLGGDPLRIDPQTGIINGVPNLIGNFVVGVCVDEFRNDTLLSTTRRDFQYNVADCGRPTAAFFAPQAICDTSSFHFINLSTAANTYQWFFEYPDGTLQSSTATAPTHTFPDTGLYRITLIASPQAACNDTFTQTLWVTRATLTFQTLFDYPACDTSGITLRLNDLSNDTQGKPQARLWTLTLPDGTTLTDTAASPNFKSQLTGPHQVTLEITAANGCMLKDARTLYPPLPPTDLLADSLRICAGDAIPIFPQANPDFQYSWSPTAFLSNAASPNPIAQPLINTLYRVTISGNGPCTREGSVFIKMLDSTQLRAIATPTVIYPGDMVVLTAIFNQPVNFSWSPPNSVEQPTNPTTPAYPTESTTYTVKIPSDSDCVLTQSVQVTVLSPKCDDTFVFLPTAFSPNGDGENEVVRLLSRVVTDAYWVVYNRWGEKVFEATDINDAWDGTYKGTLQPSDTYGYYLKATCLEGTIYKQGNITLLR